MQTCASTVTSGSYLAGYCPVTNAAVTDSLTSFQYITVPGTNTITFATGTVTDTLTGTISTAVLYAPLFQINWQATDRPVTSTSTSSTSTTAESLPTTLPAISVTATPSSSSGLSTGAKVAIGVVIPVVVLAVAGALGFWLLRRRRWRQAPLAEPGPMSTSQDQTEPRPPTSTVKRSELDAASPRSELETPRPELAGNGQPSVLHELES